MNTILFKPTIQNYYYYYYYYRLSLLTLQASLCCTYLQNGSCRKPMLELWLTTTTTTTTTTTKNNNHNHIHNNMESHLPALRPHINHTAWLGVKHQLTYLLTFQHDLFCRKETVSSDVTYYETINIKNVVQLSLFLSFASSPLALTLFIIIFTV